ncbi:MAG: DUF501 domain-containing protein [Propionibacterium sp.]
MEPVSASDEAVIEEQIGRTPRSLAGVAWRCPCGRPGVIATKPRLPDGSPFPTFYYLSCPSAVAECSRLEASGLMAGMTAELAHDAGLARGQQRAHEAYLADREQYGVVPELAGVTAGGMPARVKCLHAMLAHALAAGPGVNPIGDKVAHLVGSFWKHPCTMTSERQAE